MSTLARNGADIAIPMAVETDPQECARIKIQDQFELGLGEWFIDQTQGVPYVNGGSRQVLGVKNPNLGAIRALFRSIILQTPGIVAVQELTVSYDPGTRQLSYSFAAVDDTGALVEGGDTPFVVGGGPA